MWKKLGQSPKKIENSKTQQNKGLILTTKTKTISTEE